MPKSKKTTRTKSASFGALSLRSKAAIVGVLILTGFTANAQAMSNMSDNPTSGQLARARQICESVIRVRPGEEHFTGCVSSLTGSLQNVSRVHAVVQARNACFAEGLKPDSTDLSLCLLQADDARPAAEAASPPGMANTTEIEMKQSSEADVSTSFDAVFHREQQACAQLGLDAAFGTFDSCVASLQGTLQRIDFSGS
jgi:hypothetical protein